MYELGAKKLNELLDDIKWRQGDLADEDAALSAMIHAEPETPQDDLDSQKIVVDTQRKVLANEIKEAEELDAELERVKAEIERLSSQEVKKRAEEEGKAEEAHGERAEKTPESRNRERQAAP